MKPRFSPCPRLIACLAIAVVAGCGETPAQKQDKGFFTSGNREADQRAEQRMAHNEQLNAGNNSGGEKTGKDQQVIATEKKSLYQRLGGDDGVTKIVDDFVDRALADPRVNWARVGVKRGGFSIHRGQSEQWDANPENV